MTDQELRQLVHDAVARHLRREPSGPQPFQSSGQHPSHGLMTLVRGGDDGPCLIEPTVRCTHCGYCQSYGH
jgi:hypothetical protein